MYEHSIYYVGIGSSHAQKVAKIAEKNNDPLICSKIKKGFDLGPGPGEQDMIDECYYVAGMEMNSVSFCNLMPQSQIAGCLSSIAFRQKDVSLCGNDTLCIFGFTQNGTDKSVCQNISGTDGRDLCYVGAAQFSKDLNICNDDIQSSNYKNQCYKAVAMGTGKSSLCSLIKNEPVEVADCLRYISATNYK